MTRSSYVTKRDINGAYNACQTVYFAVCALWLLRRCRQPHTASRLRSPRVLTRRGTQPRRSTLTDEDELDTDRTTAAAAAAAAGFAGSAAAAGVGDSCGHASICPRLQQACRWLNEVWWQHPNPSQMTGIKLVATSVALLMTIFCHTALWAPSDATLCFWSLKLVSGLYVLTRCCVYLFLFARGRVVNPLQRRTSMETIVLLLTVVGVPLFACFVFGLAHGTVQRDAFDPEQHWCLYVIPGGLTIIMIVLDVSLSAMYLGIFLAALHKATRDHASFDRRASVSATIRVRAQRRATGDSLSMTQVPPPDFALPQDLREDNASHHLQSLERTVLSPTAEEATLADAVGAVRNRTPSPALAALQVRFETRLMVPPTPQTPKSPLRGSILRNSLPSTPPPPPPAGVLATPRRSPVRLQMSWQDDTAAQAIKIMAPLTGPPSPAGDRAHLKASAPAPLLPPLSPTHPSQPPSAPGTPGTPVSSSSLYQTLMRKHLLLSAFAIVVSSGFLTVVYYQSNLTTGGGPVVTTFGLSEILVNNLVLHAMTWKRGRKATPLAPRGVRTQLTPATTETSGRNFWRRLWTRA
jgi:hypothetical protein